MFVPMKVSFKVCMLEPDNRRRFQIETALGC